MSRRNDNALKPAARPAQSAQPAPSPRSLAALSSLAVLSALWAVFLWSELVRARTGGGRPFCPMSAPDTCAALWDGPFAAAVHRLTGLPLAGWGLVWSLAALALPLAALVRRAYGQAAPALVTGIRVLAAGAVMAVFVLVSVIAAAGRFCPSCLTAHVLAGAYAVIVLWGWRRLALPAQRPGLALALVSLLVPYLLLLYPGHATPRSVEAPGSETLAVAATNTPRSTAASPADPALFALIDSLDPGLKQTLSDALRAYRNGIVRDLPRARFMIGPENAPLRITEFTDVRCDHCAALHRTLARLRQRFDAAAFSVEPRQFPLDGECNPSIRQRSDPVRCLAAKALICMEGRESTLDYSGALFERQKTLTAEQVIALAAPAVPRSEMEACVASPDTARKLSDDIHLALEYQPEGTPLVLINGRRAVSFPPFLVAMVLTRGAADRPAFASLPPGDPNAQLY